jgi:hypothetical protein
MPYHPNIQETTCITPDKANKGSATEICPASNAPPAIENIRKTIGVILEFQRGTVFSCAYIIEVAKTVAIQKKADSNPTIVNSMSRKIRPNAYIPDSTKAKSESHASRLNQLDFH